MPKFTRFVFDKPAAVNKIIHHIWLGSAPNDTVEDYVKAWATANDGTRRSQDNRGQPGGKSERYTSKVWVDRNALLVLETRNQIVAWAEKKALADFGIKSVEAFDRMRNNDTNSGEFAERVAMFASRKRYELSDRINRLEDRNLDDAERLAFIGELNADLGGPDASEAIRDSLASTLAQRRARIDIGLAQGEYEDINALFDAPEHALMKRAYRQELDLRQNMAGASDIARVLVLKQQGGVYVDVDLLPKFNAGVFRDIVRTLAQRGLVESTTETRPWWQRWIWGSEDEPFDLSALDSEVRKDITDALVIKLKLMRGEQVESEMTYLANHPFRSQLAIVNEVVGAYVDAHIDNPYSVFEPLGVLRPELGYEMGFAYDGWTRGLIPLNGFIAVADSRLADRVYQQIEDAYKFFLSEEGGAVIRAFSIDAGQPENIEYFAALWEHYTQMKDRPEICRLYLRYMQDGIVPHSGMTSLISGPSVFQSVLAELNESYLRSESTNFTGNMHDNKVSSWWTRDDTLKEMRRRLFPDAPASGLDGTDSDSANVPWEEPERFLTELTSDPESSFNYEHQFIIQMNGDSVAKDVAVNLYGKHPQESTYAQWRDGQLKVILGTRKELDAYAHGEAANLSFDGALRLTFVGHGKAPHGLVEFAGMSDAQFLDVLSRLLKDAGVRPNNKLVINLVGCHLDNHSYNHDTTTFARRLTETLPVALHSLGLSPDLTDVHVREDVLYVDGTGAKSQPHITYMYQDGRYVRDAPYVEGHPMTSGLPLDLGKHKPAASFSGSDASGNALIIVLGEHNDDLNIGAMLFNSDARSSIYVQPDGLGNARTTVYFDEKTGLFRIREGASRLKEISGDIRIHLVGGGSSSLADPRFGGKSPSQVLDMVASLLASANARSDAHSNARISLVLSGRGLVDTSVTSEATFMGKFSEMLAQRLKDSGIDAGRVSLVARIAHERIDANGNRVFITPENVSLSGDLGAIYAELTDAHFVYDPQAKEFVQQHMKMTEVGALNGRLHALNGRNDLSEPEKVYLEEAGHAHLQAFRRAMGALPVHAEGRTVREQVLADLQDVLKLSQERIDKLEQLEFPKEKGWKLDPLLARKSTDGPGYEVGFVRDPIEGELAHDDSIKWVRTEESVFMRWADRARELGRTISEGVKRVGEGGASAAKFIFSGEGEPAAVHTVTAMFLMQAMIGPERKLLFADYDDALETLARRPVAELSGAEQTALRHRLNYLRAEIATNYAQLTSGLVMDGAHLTAIYQHLKNGAAAAGVSKVAAALGALGVVFDLANVVFAGIDLSNANTVSEKTEAGFRLGTALVIAGCDIGALGAGYAASHAAGIATGEMGGAIVGEAAGLAAGEVAGTVAGVLGYITVPLIGTSIGVGEVIKGFNAVAEKVDQALHTLEATIRAVRNDAFAVKGQIASFDQNLVLTGLDLNTGEVDYGSVMIRALKKHWIGVPTPAVDGNGHDLMLDMYAPFLPQDQGGSGQAARLMALKDARAIILPVGLTHRYDFDLAASPGWRYHDDFPGLDALEKAYPDQFVWWTYSLFADYSPVKLRIDYSDTTFRLKLDEASREIAVPSVEQDSYRNKLHYRLAGNGGHYTVVLPRWATDLSLEHSASTDEHWDFDVSQAIRDYSAGGAGQIVSNILHTVAFDVDGLQIGGKRWVRFDDIEPKHVSVSATLDDKGDNRLVLGDVNGKWVPMLQMATSAGLATSELGALTTLLRTIGLQDRALRVMTNDGTQGVLDITGANFLAVTPQTDQANTAVLFNGRVLQNLPGDAAVELGFSVVADDLHITLAWQATSEITAYSTYNNMGELISASIQVPTPLLEKLFLNQGVFDQKLLKPWLDILVPEMSITLFDGTGTMVSGVLAARKPGDEGPALQHSNYRSASDSFVLTINRQAQRATVELIGEGPITASGPDEYLYVPDHYLHLLDDVTVVEIQNVHNSRIYSIDLSAGIFQGRSVTLISNAPVDLVIPEKDFSWRFDGPDLLLQGRAREGDTHGGTYTLRWMNVNLNESHNTLSVGGDGYMSLMDALEEYETGQLSFQVPRYVDPHTATAQEEARRLRERDWDRSHFTDGRESRLITYPWRLEENPEFSGLMDVTYHRRRLFSIKKDDKPREFIDTTFASDGFFLAWKVRYATRKSMTYESGDISASFLHGASGRPYITDVKVRMQAGHILDGMREPASFVGHLDALFKTGDTMQLFDDDGAYANARFVSRGTWAIDDFSGVYEGVKFSFHRSSATLTIRDTDETYLYADFLNWSPIDTESYQTIDITLADHVLQRKRIKIDPSSESVRGKIIKLRSTAPVDLVIGEGPLSYTYNGTDLQVFVAGTPLLTWRDVGGENAPAHTLQIGREPARSIAGILAAYTEGSGDTRFASRADTVLMDMSSGREDDRDEDQVVADSLGRVAATDRLVQAIAAYEEPRVLSRIGVDTRLSPGGTSLAIVR